jgi:hypothetical protein
MAESRFLSAIFVRQTWAFSDYFNHVLSRISLVLYDSHQNRKFGVLLLVVI